MLCPQYVRCKEPLSLRESIKTKLHPISLLSLFFGLSKMELSFITGCKRGCNAVNDGHLCPLHIWPEEKIQVWCKVCGNAEVNGLSNARPDYIVDARKELKPAILHYSSTKEIRNYIWNLHGFTAAYHLLILHYNFIMKYSSPWLFY